MLWSKSKVFDRNTRYFDWNTSFSFEIVGISKICDNRIPYKLLIPKFIKVIILLILNNLVANTFKKEKGCNNYFSKKKSYCKLENKQLAWICNKIMGLKTATWMQKKLCQRTIQNLVKHLRLNFFRKELPELNIFSGISKNCRWASIKMV